MHVYDDASGLLDPVYRGFLEQQHEEGMALAAASDILELHACEPFPASIYQAHFAARTLVRSPDGAVQSADAFSIAVRLPPDCRRRVLQPPEMVMWLGPASVFHPNIRSPFLCVGHLTTQTTLVDLLYQAYEIATFQRVTMVESNALNPLACVWARQNQHLLPLDRRPLKRRAGAIQVQQVDVERSAG